jgi:ribosome-associated toxin RatA of RatAB toxin-antitoxin module
MKHAALALTALICAVSSSAALPVARAEGAPPGSLPAADRLAAPSNVPSVEASSVAGSSVERLRASVAVQAPLERVRAVVFDFARYPAFIPNYTEVVVERRTPGGGSEVRFDLDELGGALHLWMRMAVSPAAQEGAVESYQGRLLAGNVKTAQMRWELEALSPSSTRLTLESHVDPDLTLVPSALVNSAGRDRIREVILAFKAEAERKSGSR